MWYIVYAIVVLIISLASYYAAQRANKGRDLTAGTVEQPTVNQGDRFGLLFGTREVKDPKVVWMGSTRTEPIQK